MLDFAFCVHADSYQSGSDRYFTAAQQHIHRRYKAKVLNEPQWGQAALVNNAYITDLSKGHVNRLGCAERNLRFSLSHVIGKDSHLH